MTKLIVWLFLYALIQFLSVALNTPLLVLGAEIVFWAELYLYLRKRNHLCFFGICCPMLRPFYSFVLLLLVPTVQLLFFGIPKTSAPEALNILLTVLAEEMAFRVIVPTLLIDRCRLSVSPAIFLSSLLFAAFHALNLLKEISLATVILQMIFAFCAGYAFCVSVQRSGSIFPSCVIHALINLTAADDIILSPKSIILIVLSSIFFLFWGICAKISKGRYLPLCSAKQNTISVP